MCRRVAGGGRYGADTIDEQNVTHISYIQDDRMTVKESCDELRRHKTQEKITAGPLFIYLFLYIFVLHSLSQMHLKISYTPCKKTPKLTLVKV